MLSSLVRGFLPRSKRLLISWQQSPSAVILEPPKIKSLTVSIVSPSICHEVMGPDAMISVLWMLNFKLAFSLSSFTFIQRLFSSSSLSAIRVVSSAYLRLLIFLLAILIAGIRHSMNVWWMNEWMSLEEYVGTVEGKEMGIGNLTFRISSGLDLWSETGKSSSGSGFLCVTVTACHWVTSSCVLPPPPACYALLGDIANMLSEVLRVPHLFYAI